MLLCLVGAIGLSLLLALPSDRATGVAGGPPPEVSVEITEAGFVPATVLVSAGATIHWTNNSTSEQTVTSASGLFDSATLAPGDGFSISLDIPGHHDYASANTPAFSGTVKVLLPGLDGPPSELASDHIPDLPLPPAPSSDFSAHPFLGVSASRTQLQIGFTAAATVAEANAALANAGIGLGGAINDFGVVLGEVDDSPDFSVLIAAQESLRADPAVEFAALVTPTSTKVLPRAADETLDARLGNWRWQVTPPGGGDPEGTGANYNLEQIRAPQAWNLLDVITGRNASIDTGVFESGDIYAHDDLDPGRTTAVQLCYDRIFLPPLCSAGNQSDHATHVAGTIGAVFDNDGLRLDRSFGVSGVNPAANITGFNFYYGASAQLQEVKTWDVILDRKQTTQPNLRVVNYSQGFEFNRDFAPNANATDTIRKWWVDHPTPNCGPGDDDDGFLAGGDDWCTWANNDDWLEYSEEQGLLLRRIAERAGALGVTIVAATGNESQEFCPDRVNADGDDEITSTEIENWNIAGRPCAGAVPLNMDVDSGFGWAAMNWRPEAAGIPKPIMVEAHGLTRHRTNWSVLGGDIMAPGGGSNGAGDPNILSTITGSVYDAYRGTSMATPHVVGLVGYLLAYKPDLTAAQVRSLVLDWARWDADAVPNEPRRMDMFSSLMAIPGAVVDLADINDQSKDGNLRTNIRADGTSEDLIFTPAERRVAADGSIDMRDFRRLRDAWLQSCEVFNLAPPAGENCPSNADIRLNGADDHPRKDLNFDGCVHVLGDLNAPDRCPTLESEFPRFDLNGDGRISSVNVSTVPLPPGSEIARSGEAINVTDLGVLRRLWNADASTTEGWAEGDLQNLMTSGDLEIHADEFFTAGATSVAISARRTDTNALLPLRTLQPGDGFLVMTVPNVPVEITARATVGNRTLVSVPLAFTIRPGEDRRLDLIVAGLELTLSRTTVPADGAGTATVRARVTLVDGGPIPGRNVTFSLTPNGTDHGTLLSAGGVTDANGVVETTFRAGTIATDYTIAAVANLGGGVMIEGARTISTRPPIKIFYLWRQDNLEWSQSGSTRWAPPLQAGQPDCSVPGVVPYCLTGWIVSLIQPSEPLERAGVISGYGDQFRLDERIAETLNGSTSTWTTTNPDGSNADPNNARTVWAINSTEVHRYADHALPASVRATDTSAGIEFRGLSALADLEYASTGAAFGTEDRGELIDMTSLIHLGGERGDDSAFQFAGDTSAPIRFARNADGTFQPYTFCGEANTTQPLGRGYRVASDSPWLEGVVSDADLTRKADYDPGDLPMPEGTERLRVRYSFVAVATTAEGPPPALTLPDCTVNNAPTASFTYTPNAVYEGRVVQFTDTSSDPENNIVSWQWNFGDGDTGSGRTPHHLYKDNGTYTATLTATDMSGLSDTHDVILTVSNLPPVAEIDNATAQVGTPLTVAYRTADPGHIDKQSLTVDITTTIPGASPQHFVQAATGGGSISLSGVAVGVYTATLTVTDKDGASSSDTATLTVTAGPVPPAPEPPGAPTCAPDVELDFEEAAFLALVNAYRDENGVGPVVAAPSLTRAAETHVHDMALNGSVIHIGSDGSDPMDRALAEGFPGSIVGENVARDLITGANVLFGWRSSTTGHNENMLDPGWVAVGIAREFSTTTGWSWATSYGDVSDCPDAGFVVAAGTLGASSLFATNAAGTRAAEDEPRFASIERAGQVSASITDASSEPAGSPGALPAALGDYGPVPAFVISRAAPNAGETVTFRNRSRDSLGNPIAATVDPGEGGPQQVAANASIVFAYSTSGAHNASASASDGEGRTNVVARPVTVGVPPTATNTHTSTHTPTLTHTATITPTFTPTSTPGAPIGACFGVQQNLSNGAPFADPSSAPAVQVDGEHVYIAWDRMDGLWFRTSSDGGATFTTAVRMAARSNPDRPMRPSIAASGPTVLVTWEDPVIWPSARVYAAVSQDHGATFAAAKEVFFSGDGRETLAGISGSTLYVATMHIRAYMSTNGGSTWAPQGTSDGEYMFQEPIFQASTKQRHDTSWIESAGSLHLSWRTTNSPALVVEGTEDKVWYRKVTGSTLGPFIELAASNASGSRMAVDGSSIYVAWRQAGGGVMMRRSTNAGASFVPAVQVTNEPATEVSLVAAGSDVFVAWRATGATGPMRLAVSHDGGTTFGAATTIAGPGATTPKLAHAGGKLFAAWLAPAASGAANELKVAVSSDGGATFGGTQTLATGVRTLAPVVGSNGSRGFFAWNALTNETASDTFFARTVDCGEPQAEAPVAPYARDRYITGMHLTDGPPYTNHGFTTQAMAASGDHVYVALQPGKFDIENTPARLVLRASHDGGATFGAPVTLFTRTIPTSSDFRPFVVAYGPTVVVLWRNLERIGGQFGGYPVGDLWSATSHDYGVTFDAPVLVHATDTYVPTIEHFIAEDGALYALWHAAGFCCGYFTYEMSRSIDDGATWSTPITVVAYPSTSSRLAAAASGGTLHLVWFTSLDGGFTYKQAYRRMTNHGATLNGVQVLGDSDTQPLVAVSGQHVYVTGGSAGIFSTTRLFHSADGGATFGAPVVLPSRAGITSPQGRELIASGADVYLARMGFAPRPIPVVIETLASHDYGATFGTPVVVSPENGTYTLRLGLTCDGLRVLWTWEAVARTAGGSDTSSEVEVYISASHDGGGSYGEKYWLGANMDSFYARHAELLTNGAGAYALWRQQLRAGTGGGDADMVFARTSPNDCAPEPPTPTPSATATSSATPTSTFTPTLTPTGTATLTPTPPPTATDTPAPSATIEATPTLTVMPTETQDPASTATPPVDTATATPTATHTLTPVPTNTPSPTITATLSPTPTATHTPRPSATPTPTLTHTAVPTATPTPTPTLTQPPAATNTSAPTTTSTPTPTATTPTGTSCAFFDGFLPPVDNPDELNTGQAGRTYPIKWRCADASGQLVTGLDIVAALGSRQVPCTRIEWDGADALETSTSGNSVLRYDAGAGQFIFNWQTPRSSTTKCYVFVLRLADGSAHSANFMLRP